MDLKCKSTSYSDWLSSVIAQDRGLKSIPDVVDTNSLHTGIAYAHLPHETLGDYMD